MKKIDLEKIFLAVIFITFLWAGIANLWDYRLSHDFPYGLMASDAFQHQTRAEGIKIQGNYRYEPFYIAGGFKDAIGFYNPLIYHLGIVFSYASGLESYDSIYLEVFLLAIISVLIAYLVMREFNRNVAIISLPLAILIFASRANGPGPYAGFTWGVWPAYIGHFFLVAFFWAMTRFELDKSYIILGLFLSGIALGHSSELIFAFVFMLAYFLIDILGKRFDLAKAKKIIFAGILFLIISAYYLIIFQFTWGHMSSYEFTIERTTFDPVLYLPDFGIIVLALMVIGFLAALITKKKSVAVISSILLFVAGLGNYYGFSRHAFRARTLWPLYLAIFFGLGVYTILKFVIKKWKTAYSLGLGMVFLVLFAGVVKAPGILQYQKIGASPGLMDSYHWNALSWIKDNTPEDAVVYFFYGDIYAQSAVLRNTQRKHYLISYSDYGDALSKGIIKRSYSSRLGGDPGGVHYAYRKSLFSYGYHFEEELNNTDSRKMDICSFDYYVIDRYSRQQPVAQYNQLIREVLLKNDFMEEVFSNEVASVLKNNGAGKDCLPEEGISLG